MGKFKRKVKQAAIKACKSLYYTERRFERWLRRKLGVAVPQDVEEARKPAPYVHPWTLEDPGHPSVVDELERRHCCGCSSCMNICPKGAITMEPDEEGFLYPVVDHDLCVNCGACVKHCPVLVEQPVNDEVDTCWAQMSDDAVRAESSSGGMFTELARYAFDQGGAVFGAAYDEHMTVRHIRAESEDELAPIRGSKYVQSQTGDCYKQVKALLKEGRFVLYSGTPCQIAGLYAYLGGSDQENLLTVDLLCHGTPSPALFRRYLEEDYGLENVADVRFRDKSAFGWSTHMNVYLKDGTVCREVCGKDPYYRMFLPCLAMRPFCSRCKFTRLPRVADFSIGDWWGIEKYDRELNDSKGTSLVMLNNARARDVWSQISPKFDRVKEFPLDEARPRNYTIDKPFKAHPGRERFFHLLEFQPFDKAVHYARDYHFDVGVFGLWYGENYGSVLTYFGLMKVLESMGLAPCLIANPLGSDAGDAQEPTAFARRQGFFITKRRPISKMGELNQSCDTFLVGSDQLWNPGLSIKYGHSYFLSFANGDRKRVAYGTSFGKGNHQIPEEYKERSRWELAKFDALSVRDDFSRRLLKDDYGCDSVKVLDPALLCDRAEYRALASTAEAPRAVEGELPDLSQGGYVLVYMLDPAEETAGELAELGRLMGRPVVVVLDMNPKAVERNQGLFAGASAEDVYVIDRPQVEQWLACFEHADCVLTDSFHGSLFSVVFEKDFVALPNARRGKERFTDALGVLGLTGRIVPKLEGNLEGIAGLLRTPVDYEAANELLERERERSYAWLHDALFAPKQVTTDRAYLRIENVDAARDDFPTHQPAA